MISDVIKSPLDLGTLAGTLDRSDTIAARGDITSNRDNLYRFRLGAASSLQIRLADLTNSVTARLFQDRNANATVDPDEVLSSSSGNQQLAIDTQNLTPGDYYLQIAPGAETVINYRLSLSSTGSPSAPAPPTTLPPITTTAATIKLLGESLPTATSSLARDAIADAAGNLYVIGSAFTTSTTGRSRESGTGFVAKFDRQNTLQWIQEIEEGEGAEEPRALALDVNGNLYVGGTRKYLYSSSDELSQGMAQRSFIVKYNDSGVKQWSVQPISEGETALNDLVIDSSGQIYVGGSSTLSAASGEYRQVPTNGWLASYNSDGRENWLRSLGKPDESDTIRGLAIAPDGKLYATGLTGKGNALLPFSPRGGILLAQVSREGQIISSKQLTDDGHSGNDIAIDGTGSLYLIDKANDSPSAKTIVKYTTTGDLQWTNQLPTGFLSRTTDEIAKIQIGADGNVTIAGRATPRTATVPDAYYATLNAQDGKVITTQTLGLSDPADSDVATSVAIGADKTIYLVGGIAKAEGSKLRPTEAFFAQFPTPTNPPTLTSSITSETLAP